ncbi:hsp90 co-chaperone Cdc37 [Geranomyces variabilis]|nr:hsp90 co-chaperone Cdc37 [Geranomyces variabilis]
MPVDYSKWDKLELSDDEDFECHPNVDKASMVRWKQADIHKHRRERKDKLAALEREVTVNNRITAALKQITSEPAAPAVVLAKLGVLHRDCHTWTEELREQYMSSMWKERDARWGPPEFEPFVDEARPKYGDLVETVMQTVAGETEDVPEVRTALQAAAATVIKAIDSRNSSIAAEVKREEAEAAKKLTVDDLKEGFNKTVVSKTPSKAPAPSPAPAAAAESTTKTKTIETIHQPGGLAQSTEEQDDEEADHITYPPAQAFSELPDMEASFHVISKHPELVSQRYSDMILADGFRKELDGQPKLAQRCVTQALLLQYCSLLGHDGISLFFARLRSGRQNASEMFNRDVVDTYKRIHERVKVIKAKQKEEEEAEQAGLQARLEACTQPDGTLAIPVNEESTDEEKKRAEVFATFPHDFQRALLMSDVDAINAHLASLDKEAAQELVKVCNEAGLLSLEVEEEDDDDNEEHKPAA